MPLWIIDTNLRSTIRLSIIKLLFLLHVFLGRAGALRVAESGAAATNTPGQGRRMKPRRSYSGKSSYVGGRYSEGFKGRVATYIERIQFRREAPWTRSARTARVSI